MGNDCNTCRLGKADQSLVNKKTKRNKNRREMKQLYGSDSETANTTFEHTPETQPRKHDKNTRYKRQPKSQSAAPRVTINVPDLKSSRYDYSAK